MAERIQVAMQGTSEEILTAVENINIKVDDTSGVLVGTDGKKYKPVFKDSYSSEFTPIAFPALSVFSGIGLVGDFLIATSSNSTNATTAYVLDKNTLELLYQITVPSTRLITTINPLIAPITFLLTSDYLITYTRGASTPHLLFFFNRNTGEVVHSLVLNGFTANLSLKLYLHGDSIFILPPTSQSFIYRYTITELLSMSSIAFPTVNSANFRNFTGQNVIDGYSYNGFFYLLTRVSNAQTTTIYKLNPQLQVVASSNSIPIATEGYLVLNDNKFIYAYDNYQSYFSIDPDTLVSSVMSVPIGALGVSTGVLPDISNFLAEGFPFTSYKLYDNHVIFTTVDAVGDSIKITNNRIAPYPFKRGTDSPNYQFFTVDDIIYTRFTSVTPYSNAVIKYEPSKEIVGYKEVIE